MAELQPIIVFHGHHFVRHLGNYNLIYVKLLQLMCTQFSEKYEFCVLMAELRPVIVFHGRHFGRHLGIRNPICVELLQIMSGLIPRNF